MNKHIESIISSYIFEGPYLKIYYNNSNKKNYFLYLFNKLLLIIFKLKFKLILI